jgi:CheY-like chemotaxis protein
MNQSVLPAAPALATQKRAKRILYIDDDDIFASLVKITCERKGHEITVCLESHEALAALHRTPEAWDLVITDHRMPGPDGLEIARIIRDSYPKLPCVMVSSLINDALTKAAAEAGVRRLLHKPYKADHLIVLIELAMK